MKWTLWIWTAVCAVAVATGIWWAVTDWVYYASNDGSKPIEFSVSDKGATIDLGRHEKVAIEAVSRGFFVLRRSTGEIIYGVKIVYDMGVLKLLGEQDKEFFHLASEIGGGEWVVEEMGGILKVRLTALGQGQVGDQAGHNLVVRVVHPLSSKAAVAFLLFLFGLAVWAAPIWWLEWIEV